MRTTYIAKEADIVKKWYVIDAEGVTLGRLASEVASILSMHPMLTWATMLLL